MTDAAATPEDVLARWQAAWPRALATWSRYTRLQVPRLCNSRVEAAEEGLGGSFAMIRLKDQRIVIDLAEIAALHLEDHGLEILAHEIGHHVLVPGNMTDQLRLLARIRAGLPTLESQAPMVANLYADLLINDRLQRQEGLRLADIYRRLAQASQRARPPGAQASTSLVWDLYLRIYEQLWSLERGSLGPRTDDPRIAGDAWLGARLVRVYAGDWLRGAGSFAALLLPYLVDDKEARQSAIRHLMDTQSAGQGCEPHGGIDIDEGDVVHPACDPAITGDDGAARDGDAPLDADRSARNERRGQAREPFEYGELLRAAGLALDDHDAAVRYYRERALPYLVPFPRRTRPTAPEPQLEGLDPWELGDPVDALDGLQSVLLSPRVIPGVTTVQRHDGQEPGRTLAKAPIDLDLYVDSSGSMPNPQQRTSFPSLAGAVIALSALRAGSRVQVTLWSGKKQFMHTPGFVRDEHAILRTLTGFYGGATAFPIHRLRETYLAAGRRERPAHILHISDDGVTTMFERDEQGNDGWDVSARALAAAGGGGTMVLQLPRHWETLDKGWAARAFQDLKRARKEQGWDIHAVEKLDDLLAFAKAFARRHYA